MRTFYVSFCLAVTAGLSALWGSCNLINPSEVVPTYVHIDSFSFRGEPSRFGSSSHKITNVYVYFNNAPVGVFDLPVTFPVMATEQGTLTVIPGIDNNGLTGMEVIYPFYQADTVLLPLDPGGTFQFNPVTAYQESTKLRALEDFDQGVGKENSFVRLSGDTTIVNIATPSEVFEGPGSGMLHLRPGRDSATVISRSGRYIAAGTAAYIELDYKGSMFLEVGVTATTLNGDSYTKYFIGLKPRTTWSKIYVDIGEFVNTTVGPDFRLLLRAIKPVGVTDGYMYVDNVKVVSF